MLADLAEPGRTASTRRLPVIICLTLIVLAVSASFFSRRTIAADNSSVNAAFTVSAANFEVPVAPDSIVAIFGSGLATSTQFAGTALPLTLGGTTVTVRDSLSVDRQAPLFFVSPGQINCIIPGLTAVGTATVTIVAGDGTMSTSTVEVQTAAPGIFTANADGAGVPAAYLLRLLPDSSQINESPFQGSFPNFTTRPIDLGPESHQVFLVLFLTGLRGAPDTDGNTNNGSAENVRVITGGVEFTPDYAGIAPGFFGLDQINLVLSRSLIGRGLIKLSVVSLGLGTSKEADIEIASPQGPLPPTVSAVNGPTNLLARDLLTLTGSFFAPAPAGNTVRIGGVEADVQTASPTQLLVRSQFGTASGPITVGTNGGQWTSPSSQSVRTSLSGVVTDTNDQPLAGAFVSLVAGGMPVSTQQEGWFVLPDVPAINALAFKVDIPTGLVSYLSLPLKMDKVTALKDNPYAGTISLNQVGGAETTIGGSGFNSSGQGTSRFSSAVDPSISVGGITLTLPEGLTAIFPNGSTTGTIFLDVVANSLTPVRLPRSIFSSSIAQIAPFGVKLQPGAKLTFPNPDGLPPNTTVTLFRYDVDVSSATFGTFIDTGKQAVVSSNGATIETEAGAVTETSFYFVARARALTSIIGRVVDSDGITPRRGARVRARGQEATTDGNGGFFLRDVPVQAGDQIQVNASLLRASGRLDTAAGRTAPAVIRGLTKIDNLVLSSATSNRAPLIYAKSVLQIYPGEVKTFPIGVVELDEGQTLEDLALSGPAFAQLNKTGANAYTLRVSPQQANQGNHILSLSVRDSAGATTRQDISVLVKPPPVANSQALRTNEDTPIGILLSGSDSENRPLTYKLKSGPLNGILTGTPPGIGYAPRLNFNGQDSFTFAVDNGLVESAPATVTIAVAPVNDPPVIVVPGNQSAQANTLVTFNVTASDPDAGQTITLSAMNLPTGAQFNQTGPTSGTFSWTPTDAQAGPHVVTFIARDNAAVQLMDTKTVTITVATLGTWRPTSGPDGGTINAFINVGGVILAGSGGNGIFRSTDNGTTWLPANAGLGNGVVHSFVSVQAPAAILAGTDGGVFRTTNNGISWSSVSTGLPNAPVRALTNSLGNVFAGTDGGGVYRLSNVSNAWSATNTNLPNPNVRALTNIGEVLYAATAVGVSTSNSGMSWAQFSTGLPAQRVVTFAIRSIMGGNMILLAGTDGGGVYQRILGGASWSSLNIGLSNLNVNAIATNGGSLLYAGTTLGGVFRMDASVAPASWVAVNNGLTNPIVRALLGGPNSVFAGTREGGVFRSLDNGNNWAAANNGLPRALVTYLHSVGNALIAATQGGGIYATTNGGGTWTGFNTGLTNLIVSSIASNAGNVFIGTFGGGVFRSTNGGASWSPSNSGLGNLFVQSLLVNGNQLFAGTDSGNVFVSSNNGANWSIASPGLGAAIYSLFANAGFLYAGTNGAGAFRSANSGASWTQINSGLGGERVGSFAVIGGTLFAGTLDGGVYRSTDNGTSWTSANNGISSTNIFALLADGTSIYAGSNSGGVFVSMNQGTSWQAVNQGLAFPFVVALAKNGNSVFAGTDGGGVWILDK